MTRPIAALVGITLAVGTVGCQANAADPGQAPAPETPKTQPAAAVTPTGSVGAKAAGAPAKEQPFYEIESDGRVYVFGSIKSANARAEGVVPTAPPVVKERFSKRGKTVVFENLGPQTDALIAAWAKANGVSLK